MAFLSSNWGPIALIVGLVILALGLWGSFKKDAEGRRGENALIWMVPILIGGLFTFAGVMMLLPKFLGAAS